MTSASHLPARHARDATGSHTLTRRARLGLLGGLLGGVLFGVVMQVLDLMPMVARLVGASSPIVAWIVHLAIAAGVGLLYALILGPLVRGLATGLVTGILWGMLWWVVGAMILMPTFLGTPNMVLEFSTAAWQSLLGHVVYGFVLGTFFGLTAPGRAMRPRWR